jgi:2-methylisocitrate lyase-like PEP mutase family enzyme
MVAVMHTTTSGFRTQRAARDAALLRAMHQRDEILVLPNAWDAMSAAIVAAAGARAVATTSGGVSWTLGRRDGEGLTGGEAIGAIERIVAAVDLPVTADIEGGYGLHADAVGATVAAVIAAGAAGINLEDSPGTGTPLIDPELQARRIRAARKAGRDAGVEVVINARTDVYLRARAAFDDPLAEVIARGQRYGEAGADCLFVPGLLDLPTIAALVERSPLPINIMAGPGAPTVAELARVGVKRVSVGTAIAQAAYRLVQRGAVELLQHGTYEALVDQFAYGELNALAKTD